MAGMMIYTRITSKCLKGRDHCKELEIDGRVMLRIDIKS
jgi:hypothetical protein